MTRRLPLSLVMLTVGVGLLVTAASARPVVSATEARKGGTLRWSTGADVDHVDPALLGAVRSFPIALATCAMLFHYPDAPGAAGTRLAKEVADQTTVSKDRRTYTFDLKQTFRFHTGAPVTAQSFADAFNRDANPKLGSPAVAYLHEIVGADAAIDGKATSISGIRVLGRYRLQIRLTRPVGDFTTRLTMPFFCPILPTTPTDEEMVTDPPGSGPYYVAERIVNQRIVLERNPYYRGDRPAYVDQVVWTINPPEACVLAVEKDRIDYCYSGLYHTPRALVEKYGINRPGGQFFVSPALTTWYLAFNHARPAFRGPGQIPLEKAINYAIDRPELARAFGYLAGKRTDQMLPPALARRASIYPLGGADPATARKWLARAARPPTELVLYADNSTQGVLLAQTIVFNLKQIGIDVHVKYFDINTLGAKTTTPGEPWDLTINGWTADYPDGGGFIAPLLAAGQVGSNLDDPRVARRMEAASRLTGEARRKAWADLDVYLMRTNPPWAPIIHANNRIFVSGSVGCVFSHLLFGLDIAAVCKK
ncbi:ABC transporter substrate-binding protein [Gaiella sp.]|jgi:peptide/nickel transport system substrate-binding protein|uniref:ABC transporter substrate-binding protein n=1 Tax=Gaiella sp. TaxID=2663207 RepID=UPI002C7FB6D8|nr:ABC transporter substrate-binding protein [Gaiella sp.]HWO80193.1 ABC transporter substrate-binding protein [Gaiella sp.]